MNKSGFTFKLVAALTARNAEMPSADTVLAINNATRAHEALDDVMGRPMFAEIARTLIKRARIADAKQDKANYVAVKVLVKVVSTLQALRAGMPSALDPYTRTLAANLCKLNGISNKSTQVALSKSVVYDALDQTQALSKRYNCSANTASSQAGQVRMVMLHLGIADVVKGKRGDCMTLQDNDRARALVALFSEKTIAEESAPAA
jgi:hypothetical protein